MVGVAATKLGLRVRLVKVHTDAQPTLFAGRGIRSIPMPILFRERREMAGQGCEMTEPAHRTWSEQHVGA